MFEANTVNGTAVNMVKFSYLAGEDQLGTYRQVAPAAWQEVDIQNNATFYFAETQRTDISITLYDASRNVTLVFDLNRSVIVYTDSNNHFDLYRIMEATAYVQGWIANLAHFSLFNGTHLGEFRQTGEKRWVEFGKGGVPRFHFVETLRDDWSVYLHDESRNVGIQLDFWRKMVIYSDATPQQFDLYPITGGAVMSSRADLTPSLTGKTVNRIDFGTADGQILGYLRKNGLYEWVELGLDQKERFYFTETKSHKGVVVLVDVARSVTLELHLRSKKIIYSDAAANRFELYKIVNAYGKVNGWTANRVDFGSFTGAPLGTYRQTGEKTWAELNSLQKPVFYFNELLRDDWSVYLYDPSRNVTIQLDMYTQKVVYGTQPAQGERSDLYGIVRASAKPSDLVITSPLPVKGQNVKTVWFADFNGKPLGAYRQIAESKWVETDSQAKPAFSFDEVQRTKYAVHLYDVSRNVSLELNLHTRRIHYSDPSNSFVLYTILRSSALVTGRAVSEVTFATFAGQELGKYRQTSGDEWAEFNQSGTVTAHFKETRREDWLVTLYDASRNVTLALDLHSQTIYYSDGQTYYAPLYLILREEIEAAVWMQSENITSRSSLTQDFAPDRTARNLNPQPAYRTSISVTRLTSFVDIWASEEVMVEVNGTSYTIDPVKSARVQPNALSKLSVSLQATDVRCPTLIVRTNLMMPDEKHYIFPDIEAHKKIVNLKDGDLYKARTQLGISDQYTEEDMAHVQQSLQNIAKTVQHTYNKKPHGVHHDRALLPKNMQHPHFVLDFTEDRPRYRPLHPSEVPALTTGATLIQGTAAQGFFDDVGNFFKKAAAVVVHTVENVGHDIVQTAENIGHDIVQTVDNLGEDIVHGDIAHIGQDLLQGGENIGSDLVKGAGHVVGDVVEGAGQLLVVTLHAAEGMVQFVINHTGFVGKALGWLLEKIGAGLDKVVDWLLDKLGWEDILHTHDVLFQLFNNKVDEFATYPEMIKQRGDHFFTHITDLVSQTMDQAIKQFDVQDVTKQPQPVKGHSGAVEKIEWILGKLVQYAPQATALAYPSFTPSYHSQADGLVGLLEQQLGGGGQVMKALRQAEEDLVHVFTDPEHSPEYLISLLLELVKAVAVLSLETVKLVFDAILDLIIGLIQAFKTAVNAPWDIPFLGDLYDTLTEGRPLTFLSMICLVIA
ncbi:MAG: hypothetical protein IT327_20345, partial [Anaerolineae bacterium]|nr:hypothetical protein [Anaerolineae bacterium]